MRVERVPSGAPPRWVEGVKSDADDEEPDCITIKSGRRWECIPPEEAARVEYVVDREGNYALEGAAIGLLVDVCVVLALASTIDYDFNPGVPTGR